MTLREPPIERTQQKMQDEKKVGLVPRIVVQGKWGPQEYAVLVTDKRSIFVLEKSSKAGIAGALGGAIGAAVAQAASSRRTFDYQQMEPDALAMDPKNLVIPHEALERIHVKKGMLGPIYRFSLEYTREGKDKKLKGQLIQPSELWNQKKQAGMGRKEANQEYAMKVQAVYQQALPPTMSASILVWQS